MFDLVFGKLFLEASAKLSLFSGSIQVNWPACIFSSNIWFTKLSISSLKELQRPADVKATTLLPAKH
ncbi:MAG: hypothetical protein IPN33_22705 [Saprospiraceae bacterium]|nr:hypothetical protein [Saprospiraceae bacterium]